MNPRLANLIGFQLVWLAAVGGAARGLWWLGPLALLGFASWQLGVSAVRRADVGLMLAAALIGAGVDTLWVQLDWMRFASPLPWSELAPVWIVAMWMGFALTLNHSLAAFKRRLALAAAFGLLGGPFAYWVAAHSWQAVAIDGLLPYLALGVAWAVLAPALLIAATWLDPARAEPLP